MLEIGTVIKERKRHERQYEGEFKSELAAVGVECSSEIQRDEVRKRAKPAALHQNTIFLWQGSCVALRHGSYASTASIH